MTAYKPAHLQKQLLARLGQELAAHGFEAKARGQSFYKPMPFGWWGFHVSFIPHKGELDLTADVAIRFDAVEDLVNASDTRLSGRAKRESATMGAELGNIADHRQRRWTLASPEQVNSVARAVIDEFQKFGLPYLQRLSSYEEAFKVLSRNDPAAWLHSPLHDVRCKRAVALAILLGRRDEARDTVRNCEEFLRSTNDLGLRAFQHFAERALGGKTAD